MEHHRCSPSVGLPQRSIAVAQLQCFHKSTFPGKSTKQRTLFSERQKVFRVRSAVFTFHFRCDEPTVLDSLETQSESSVAELFLLADTRSDAQRAKHFVAELLFFAESADSLRTQFRRSSNEFGYIVFVRRISHILHFVCSFRILFVQKTLSALSQQC